MKNRKNKNNIYVSEHQTKILKIFLKMQYLLWNEKQRNKETMNKKIRTNEVV